MLARLEREGRISIEQILVRLYETAASSDYAANPDRNAAARLFLDRALARRSTPSRSSTRCPESTP